MLPYFIYAPVAKIQELPCLYLLSDISVYFIIFSTVLFDVFEARTTLLSREMKPLLSTTSNLTNCSANHQDRQITRRGRVAGPVGLVCGVWPLRGWCVAWLCSLWVVKGPQPRESDSVAPGGVATASTVQDASLRDHHGPSSTGARPPSPPPLLTSSQIARRWMCDSPVTRVPLACH